MQVAWLDTAAGLGMLSGGLALSAWGGFRQKIKTMLLGLVGLGVGCVVIAMAPSSALPVSLVGAAIIGIALPIVDGPYIAMLQSMTDPSVQGRVFSLAGSLGKLTTPLGLAVAGPLADRIGIPPIFGIAAVVTLALACAALALPRIRNIEESRVPLDRDTAPTCSQTAPASTAD